MAIYDRYLRFKITCLEAVNCFVKKRAFFSYRYVRIMVGVFDTADDAFFDLYSLQSYSLFY